VAVTEKVAYGFQRQEAGMKKVAATDTAGDILKHQWSKKEIGLGLLAIAVTMCLCAIGIYYKQEIVTNTHVMGYGLVGVFIVSFIASSAFSVTAIPVPYWLVVLTMPSILAPMGRVLSAVWVGLMSAVAASLGQSITFMIGYGSRGISERVATRISNRFYDKAIEWAQQHGSWAVFLMSAIPNGMHLPMTIAIAALRYPTQKFFIYCFLGNVIKNLSMAFAGYFGLTSIFSWLQG